MLLPHGTYRLGLTLVIWLLICMLPCRAQVIYFTQPWSYSVNYTFGRGTTNPGAPLTGAVSDLVYTTNACPLPGQYAVTNKVDCPGLNIPKMKVGGYEIGSTWFYGPNQTNDEPPGYMMLASYHPSAAPRILFEKTVKGLCSGRDYLFWAAIRNLLPNSSCFYPNFSFTVETTGGALIQSFPTGDLLGSDDQAKWYPGTYFPLVGPPAPFYGGTFTLPAGVTDIVLKIIINPSNAISECVAGIAVDNILLTPMGPNVTISIPGKPGSYITGACYLGNVPLVLNGSIGDGYQKFGTPDFVSSIFVNPAVQWQQSFDEGYTWQDIPGETNLAINHVFHNPDTFYVRVRAAEAGDIGNLNCNVVSNVIKVEVDSLPAGIVFSSNSPVCEDSDVVFNLAGGASYLLSGPNGYTDNTSKPHVFHPSLADSGWYHVQVISFGGCPVEDSTHVVIRGPAITVSGDETICYGDPVRLKATGGNVYSWSPALGLSADSVAAPLASPPRTTAYTVRVSDTSGCSAFGKVTITLRDSVLRAAFAGPVVACPRDIVQWMDSSVGKLASWRWELGEGQGFDGRTPPPQSYPHVGEYAIRLIVTDSAGCADTASTVLRSVPNCFIAVPGAFSPNGDGVNDFLYPLDAYKATDLVFRVYNRQGQMVWETRDWTRKWDGRVGGRLMPAGVLVWTLEYTDADHRRVSLKGTTVLVR
jgi:gliding motility-associated-like protein